MDWTQSPNGRRELVRIIRAHGRSEWISFAMGEQIASEIIAAMNAQPATAEPVALTAEQIGPACDAQRRSSQCVEVVGWTARHERCRGRRIGANYRSEPCECPCHEPWPSEAPDVPPGMTSAELAELEQDEAARELGEPAP